MYSVTKKILHLKDLGFKGNLDEVIKMYNGEQLILMTITLLN